MIELREVYKRFRTPVLEGVSMNVPEGSIYALIGPGASGKSVILKMMAGLVKPDRGEVEVDGDMVSSMDEADLFRVRQKIGMLFQNYALFDLDVAGNISFPLRRGAPELGEEEIAERVAERLARVSLPGTETRNPQSMSGGQKKRVGVARATITKPPIVLYDEPTAGLDPVTSQKIYDLVREEQRASGATCVVISSDVAGVLGIADRVGMLVHGRILFEGSAEEAKASEIPEVRQFVHGLTEGPL